MTERRAFDFYETAPWQVDALVDHLPELQTGTVFCPCVGDGSLMRQLQARRPALRFVTSDILPGKGDLHGDATDPDLWEQVSFGYGPIEWVVENFPFAVEAKILQHAVRWARGVAAMARVSFTEPTKDRGLWLSEHPYQKRITLERHSFTRNGKSDMTTTDWLVWAKMHLSGPFGISAYGYRSGYAQEKRGRCQ